MLTLWSIVCAIAFFGLILVPALYLRCRWYRRECDLLAGQVSDWIDTANGYAREIHALRNGDQSLLDVVNAISQKILQQAARISELSIELSNARAALIDAGRRIEKVLRQRDAATEQIKNIQDSADQMAVEAAAEIGRLKTQLNASEITRDMLHSENAKLTAKFGEMREWRKFTWKQTIDDIDKGLDAMFADVDPKAAVQPTEYDAGRQAFRDGLGLDKNPFAPFCPPKGEEDGLWRSGWWCSGWEFERDQNGDETESDVEQDAGK